VDPWRPGDVQIWGGDSSLVARQFQGGIVRRAFVAVADNGSVLTWGRADFGGDSSSVASKLQ
jgi:hypothetical protein